MNIHDIIANEFVETKSIASFIYLVELGREVELLSHRQKQSSPFEL